MMPVWPMLVLSMPKMQALPNQRPASSFAERCPLRFQLRVVKASSQHNASSMTAFSTTASRVKTAS